MNSILIEYDVSSDVGADAVYHALREAITAYGTWAHISKSCWAIKTTQSAAEVRDALLRLMRPQDRLFVVQTAHVAAWNNVMCTNEWLREHI